MPDRVYRAAPSDMLRIEALGDLTVLFDRRSMQTHLMTQPMPEILAVMADDRCNAAMVAERLAARFDLGDDGDPTPLLAERLAELAAMGLVAEG